MKKIRNFISILLMFCIVLYLVNVRYIQFFIRTDTPEKAVAYEPMEKGDRVSSITQIDDTTVFAEIETTDNITKTILIRKDRRGWIPQDSFSKWFDNKHGLVGSDRSHGILFTGLYTFDKIDKDGYLVIFASSKSEVSDNIGTKFTLSPKAYENGAMYYHWYAHVKDVPRGYTIYVDGGAKKLT